MKILVLHGVNLNMFGRRDPAHYGTATLENINESLRALGETLGAELTFFQTNHEGEMVERIHRAVDENYDAVIINPAAWTHYSYAIADAMAILTCPIVEVHMSRIFDREEFRRHSVLAPIEAGSIAGFGIDSYRLGLRAACALAKKKGGGF